jgi:hypothetical protein
MPISVEVPSRTEIEKSIAQEFTRVVASSPALGELVEELSASGPLVIFGGFVRDRIHNMTHRARRISRDIDLVLCGALGEAPESAQRNNFGGYRRTVADDLTVDYWELDKTYAFSHLFKPSIENLPLTTVYTLNACVFDLVHRRLIEHNAIASIARRTISFNCRDYLDKFPSYQAFRAMDFADRLEYTLDDEVRLFVRQQIHDSKLEEFVEAVQSHRRGVTQEDIAGMFERYS